MKQGISELMGALRKGRVHYEDYDVAVLVGMILRDMAQGLEGKGGTLEMIPTYVRPPESIPADEPVIVVDAGGTNLRSALVRFDSGGEPHVGYLVKRTMPGVEAEVDNAGFFDALADSLTGIAGKSDRIGFCFSYAMAMQPDRDGRLIRICKEIKAHGIDGRLVGAELVEAMRRRGLGAGWRVTVLNDTVAALMAGTRSSLRPHGSHAAFILGTGMNACYLESHIPKLGGPVATQAVVLEAGGFDCPLRGEIDAAFDRTTADPGFYTYEKMFSGAYLGPLALHVLKHLARLGFFSPRQRTGILAASRLETADVSAFLARPLDPELPLRRALAMEDGSDVELAHAAIDVLIERASRLAASVMAAVAIKTCSGHDISSAIAIAVEGSTYHGFGDLRARCEAHLYSLLTTRMGIRYYLVSMPDSGLVGSAIAGLL
ncbi:MAG: hexokinase [Syntrophorhabdales bacterium]|jgi:hexokinase